MFLMALCFGPLNTSVVVLGTVRKLLAGFWGPAEHLTLYSISYFKIMTSFSILDNIEKIQEKIKLSFEYFGKYYGK